jgi:hypothetical protein
MQYVDYLCSLQRALAQHVRRFVCACSIAELRMQSFGLFPAHRVSLHIKGNCFLNFLKKSTELSVLCNGGRLWHTLSPGSTCAPWLVFFDLHWRLGKCGRPRCRTGGARFCCDFDLSRILRFPLSLSLFPSSQDIM